MEDGCSQDTLTIQRWKGGSERAWTSKACGPLCCLCAVNSEGAVSHMRFLYCI